MIVYDLDSLIEAKVEASNPDEKSRTERWAVAIVRDPFLEKKFITEVDFTPTAGQQKKEEEDRRKSTDIIACVKCRDCYIESENKMGVCTHHDGFVYDNSDLNLKKYRQSDAIELLNRDEFLVMADPKKKDDIERRKTRMKFICCGAIVQTGGNIGGCKKLKHGFDQKQPRTTNRDILFKEDIKEWEDACFENIYYNDQLLDLSEKRKIQL